MKKHSRLQSTPLPEFRLSFFFHSKRMRSQRIEKKRRSKPKHETRRDLHGNNKKLPRRRPHILTGIPFPLSTPSVKTRRQQLSPIHRGTQAIAHRESATAALLVDFQCVLCPRHSAVNLLQFDYDRNRFVISTVLHGLLSALAWMFTATPPFPFISTVE